MDKKTIDKLTFLSKLSIPESDIDELSKNLDNILKLIGEIDAGTYRWYDAYGTSFRF
jgi:Asp-tRNA(Asn)/Glu-tRNA(Gln) amidotransferase C subunit